MNIIDSHVHLINFKKGKYEWLNLKKKPILINKESLQHSFLETDLTLNSPFNLANFIHVEAGFNNKKPWTEIEWLETQCKLPFKSIAYIDFSSDIFYQIKKLSKYTSVAGVRVFLNKKTTNQLSPLFLSFLKILQQKKWILDLSLDFNQNQLVDIIKNIRDNFFDLKMVFDHAGLYLNNPNGIKNLKEISSLSNCYFKCSGWEMLDNGKISTDFFNKTCKHGILELLNIIDYRYILLGSNFPICTLKCTINDYWNLLYELVQKKLITTENWTCMSCNNSKKLFNI